MAPQWVKIEVQLAAQLSLSASLNAAKLGRIPSS
jgi:hypothetical protein